MPTFVHPALLWGMLIAGVPVLIHLINMFRHRRVPWAAMEFLLVSQRRNRTWILLKQLLLLLTRMTAVAVAVLMLAQPHLATRWGNVLDGRRIHHIVLLDDSYSMTDRRGERTAFDEAKEAIERVAVEASRQARRQSITLLRFSQAAHAGEEPKFDLADEPVRGDFLGSLRRLLETLEASESPTGPGAALQTIAEVLPGDSSEQQVIYLLSDFRTRQWSDPHELLPALRSASRAGAAIHLVQCTDRYRENTSISNLSPAGGTRAAGVPFFMEVEVTNYSETPLHDVAVMIEADGSPRRALQIARIPAGEAVREKFSLQFPAPGEHVVVARLEADAIAVDNLRFAAVDVPADLPVLIVDSSTNGEDAVYLAAALQPGGPVATGLTPRIEKPRYLSQSSLAPFRSVYLLNVERLDQSAVEALEEYAFGGGGIGVFLGPQCAPAFYNENLYRGGRGLFPVPLIGQEALFVDRLEKSPDLEVTSHPIFRVLSGDRNTFLSTVAVARYFSVPDPLPGGLDPSVQVIARLRNGAPLALDRRFGKGRIVTFLTTAGPQWNNWSRGNPSYVVAMLELQAYLGRGFEADIAPLVGEALSLQFDPARFHGQVRWSPPETSRLEATTAEATVLEDGTFVTVLPETSVSGIYRAELSAKDGGRQIRHFAVNVDPVDGDLELVDGSHLAAELDGVEFRYEPAASFRYAEEAFSGANLTEPLLFLLVALLLAEQVFAYWVSDHPRWIRTGEQGGAP